MNEPIYEFVKGKGWVPNTSEVITMVCGTRYPGRPYLLVNRLPEVGERYIFKRYTSQNYFRFIDKTPILRAFWDGHTFRTFRTRYEGHVFSSGGGYVTVVRL